jgi:predicted ATPase
MTGPLPPLAIPTTLHDSLMARLDRLAPIKMVAQLGATIGRQFSYELFQAVSPLDETTLQQGLHQLVEAELLYQQGSPPQATYTFKHALIQDAAYQSLLRSTRQQYHQRIAQVLAEQFPETAETQLELLAHHYTEGGLSEQAIRYWLNAGRRAIEHSANVEAIAHLTKGIEVLKMLPDTPERAQKELTLEITLGPTLMAARGYAAPEVEHAYARARELCEQVGETPQLFRVLHGLQRFYLIRAELQTTRKVGEQLLTLAQRMQESAFLLQAHRALGDTLFWLGEVAPARAHFEQGIALYDPQQHRSLAFLYGEDPGVVCLSYAARALWWLGYPDQARQRIHEALTLARELSHPLTLVFALYFAAVLHASHREAQATQEQAEAAIALSTEQEFALWLTRGVVLRGWALAEQGQGEEGITQMREGLAAYRATGAEVARPYWLALLAEAYGKLGQTEQGLIGLTEAVAVAHKTGERFYEAELYRLRGELLLQAGKRQKVLEAEESFRQALTIARRQRAKALELRAATSLARLWQHQGKYADAHQILAEVYGWFTEGFDTAGLQEARALLDTLKKE